MAGEQENERRKEEGARGDGESREIKDWWGRPHRVLKATAEGNISVWIGRICQRKETSEKVITSVISYEMTMQFMRGSCNKGL